MKKYKKLLFDKHNKFDMADNENHQQLLKFEIKSIVDEIDNPDAQDFHILGLVYYNTSEDLNDIDKAHQYFILSLKEDNQYYMARLYSAHCFHDKKEYDAALKEYLRVDQIKLKKEFPIWRYIKLQEQIGFCLHKIGMLKEAIKHFEEVLELYRTNDFDELVNPYEIYECLDKNHPIVHELKQIETAYYDK